MLNDEIRNHAFYQWLKNSITQNDFVLDIGTGSGILSLFATKFRPKRVIACEASKTLFGIAKKVIEKNNSCQVIDLKHCLSTQLELNEQRADILVTETFDAGLLGKIAIKMLQSQFLLPENYFLFQILDKGEKLLLVSSNANFEFRGSLFSEIEFKFCKKASLLIYNIQKNHFGDKTHLNLPAN